MEREDSITMKQLYFFFLLLEQQLHLKCGLEIKKFEEIEGIKIFELSKTEVSSYIDKLKGDIEFLERISNQIAGTN